ncbi:MAG: filamentous hemagglutinin N-terminal domain-containing protein [Nitrospira sp.]|nr:filamentous hemagglutinin N-terminal domain-containing protein [Nitrospira sp.]
MKQPHREHVRLARYLTVGFFLLLAIPCAVSIAQVGTPITSSGLNTTVSAPVTLPTGQTQFNITGGTRPGGGSNLFHSFGNFNVPNNNIANFLNNSGLPTSNILGRVTGGNPSNILGSIQTTGFGNANLFLINPAGFLFGPNATVNVGGMMTFTSADYLRLSDNARFNAIPRTGPDQLLSAAPVAAFGFLGSNPGAITVQGSHLSVVGGTGISLVGGNITIQDGTLTAPSGQINLVSVGKPSNAKVGGEVVVSGVGQGSGFTPTGFKSLGAINLSQGSTVDTSVSANGGNSAGGVSIRAGEFVMNNSSVKAEYASQIFNASNPSVGGNIEVTAKHIDISNGSRISTTNQRYGSAGDITFNTETFSAKDSAINASAGWDTSAAGAVTIQGLHGPGDSARSVSVTNTTVDTSNRGLPDFGSDVRGGPIAIRADNIEVTQSLFYAYSYENTGGAITLVGNNRIESRDSSFSSNSIWWSGGLVDFTAGNSIDLTNTLISTRSSIAFNGGNISLAAPSISIKGSQLDARSGGIGHGGTISITGKKSVSLTDTALSADNYLNYPFFTTPPRNANGGTIHIDGGSQFTSQQSTISAQSVLGSGGSIHIEAQKATLNDTVLTTSVSGGPQTVGGSITVDAKNVTVKNSQILSTATEGQGGTIEISSHNRRPIANSVIDATSQLGTDGTVTIH